jgi:hypothetical protein
MAQVIRGDVAHCGDSLQTLNTLSGDQLIDIIDVHWKTKVNKWLFRDFSLFENNLLIIIFLSTTITYR